MQTPSSRVPKSQIYSPSSTTREGDPDGDAMIFNTARIDPIDILEILKQHDETNPINRRSILLELAISPTEANDRALRRIISDKLMLDYPIGSNSSCKKGNKDGYYLITSFEGLNRADMEDRKRATNILLRIRHRRQAFDRINTDKLFATQEAPNAR